MSIDPTASVFSAPLESHTDSLAWLQDLLRSAMEGVMAAEGEPIRKANTLARLAGLYLKTCHVTEVKQAHKQLTARVAELEQAMEAPAGSDVAQDERLAGDDAGEPLWENPTEAGEDRRIAAPPVPSHTHSLHVASEVALPSTTGSGRSSGSAPPHSRDQRKRKRK